jgi:hypothetical protein
LLLPRLLNPPQQFLDPAARFGLSPTAISRPAHDGGYVSWLHPDHGLLGAFGLA